MGGGARNLGAGGPGGGDACLGGEGTGLADEARLIPAAEPSFRVRRAGGGAGGGPLLEEPVFCGLRDAAFAGGAVGGGGGGALALRSFALSAAIFSSALRCSI